jgi:hypothetical protein
MHAEPFNPDGVTWSSVSPALARARRLVATGWSGAALVVATALALANELAALWAIVALIVAGWGWSWWMIGRQVRAIGYAERESELLVRRGIMWRSIVVVPYGRLQFVDVEAGPLDRMFGIARVQLHTASTRTDAAIPGLPADEAARVRDRLTERGELHLAGL